LGKNKNKRSFFRTTSSVWGNAVLTLFI